VWGALSIYSDEVDRFSDKDVKLLEKVAGDIDFALDNLDREFRRNRAEEALRESEEKYRQIFETANEGICVADGDYLVTCVNQKMADMLGYLPQEIIGKPLAHFLFPEEMAYYREKISLRVKGLNETYEGRFRRKDGGKCWANVSATAIRTEDGRFMGSFAMLTDITERKRAEAMLARVNRQNELLLNSVGDGIYGLDLEGRTTFVNPKAVNLVGYSLEEMIGRPQHDLIHHTKSDGSPYRREECPICAAFKDGQVHHVDTDVFWRKDGTSFPVAFTSTPIRDENGELQGAVVVFSDITERKRAEAEKIQMEQRLQKLEKAESLGRMAGSIAHHFNNKLAAVMGNLELALDDLPQGSDARASIVESMKASRQAAEVSQLMLAYLGQTTGRKEPVDLLKTIRETLPVLDTSTSQHVHLKTDFPPQRPIILGNNVHVKQMITNLVSNAAEAIDQNEGDITVTIQVMATAEIRGLRFFPLDWEPKAEQYVCLSVSDTGCGMDVATQEKVFDPFFSTKFTGRGLGMSVLLGLVRTHDGAITVMSSPGRGAMFRVFFPLHALEAVPPLEEEPLTSKPVEEGGLVLVVDDDSGVRNMAQSMLKRMGYEVIAAGDGYEAVEMFRARKDEINFVLLDLSMPGMDGWETLAQLRSLRPDIPVVLASGYEEAQLMQGDHPHRPRVFLHKPYLKSDLEAAIYTALKKAVSTG
jgi:PAS domain S-box-containing protein